jgi:hypothetical protein
MAPPLVEEDGFESATGEALGGASVLSGAGAPVISGARSLYIPPARGSGSTSTQLSLRLPRAPGDTVLRFAFRRVTDRLSGSGNHTTTLFQVAGQGGEIASLVERAAEPTEEITIPGATAPVRIGPIMTAEIALPPDATGEVVVARIATETPRAELCAGFPARPIAGVIIDDLRAE